MQFRRPPWMVKILGGHKGVKNNEFFSFAKYRKEK
jgi:hypothetical protein